MLAPLRKHRDFLAVVIQLLRADIGSMTMRGEFAAHRVQTQPGFLVALLHRQLEIEDRVPAPALGEPLRNQRRDAPGCSTMSQTSQSTAFFGR